MNLERSLVLNRFLLHLLGASDFEELRASLRHIEEGPGPDGQSRFHAVLSGRTGLRLDPDALRRYDHNVMEYEAELARTRRKEPFRTVKYFQYLALLCAEIYLDRLTANPREFLRELNAFRASQSAFAGTPEFTQDDLRRMAFFMATGSGKTLLLHVNIRQVLHYLQMGEHPEALVRRTDGRRQFDNILLITPGEGLSDQHLAELDDSGLDAARLERGMRSSSGFEPRVHVIEIHKLVEGRAGEGVSIPISELGARNLVIVDEGHKGAGSEARTWKNRQEALSKAGFLLEYSATFKQAIGAATPKVRRELLNTYGKSIVFDYSYRHFHEDGHGKEFRVLNLSKSDAGQAHGLMLGGLLTFYQQTCLYSQHPGDAADYAIERPLWVLLGTSVSKSKADQTDSSRTADEERSDVAEVVAFLKRFLENPEWATSEIAKFIAGESGFADAVNRDMFAPLLKHLSSLEAVQQGPQAVYDDICARLFHGKGALEVVEIKGPGEIGLRVSAASGAGSPYFGVINIGDVADFLKHLREKLGIEKKEDVIGRSLFEVISRNDSSVTMLIGAKKFIEGWSSWRVSCMGLMRVGKGEGSQVMQLFGRGVRLKGRDKSLKRSHQLADAPAWLEALETLYIVGWNADYMQAFQEILTREDLWQEVGPLRLQQTLPGFELWVPALPPTYRSNGATWVLDADGPLADLNLRPEVQSLSSTEQVPSVQQGVSAGVRLGRNDGVCLGLLDWERLHADLLEYKRMRGYGNLLITRSAMERALAERCDVELASDDAAQPERIQRAALRVLRLYVDRFVRHKEREEESKHLRPTSLSERLREHAVPYEYSIRVRGEDKQAAILRTKIEELVAALNADPRYGGGEQCLPRLYLCWQVHNPLLTEGGQGWPQDVSISPPPLNKGEAQLVLDLKLFWQEHHKEPRFANTEVSLIRNPPRTGVRLYARSGFYPDFILWIRNNAEKCVKVVFLDPHGLVIEKVGDHNDRIKALEEVRRLSREPVFTAKRITLDGYLLVPDKTDAEAISDLRPVTKAEIESRWPVRWQDEGRTYIERLFD